MAQYQVPQFIELEDKIIGPLTLKQFMWLGGGGGFSFILFYIIKPSFFWPLMIIIMSTAGLFAFYKVNGRPFIDFLGSMTGFVARPSLYVWRRIPKIKKGTKEVIKKEEPAREPKKLTESRLKELAWTLDVPGNHETRNM